MRVCPVVHLPVHTLSFAEVLVHWFDYSKVCHKLGISFPFFCISLYSQGILFLFLVSIYSHAGYTSYQCILLEMVREIFMPL